MKPVFKSPSGAGKKTSYTRAMEALNPDVSLEEPRLREAAALVRRGHFESAASLAQALLNSEPQNVQALFLKADIARRKGWYRDAEQGFARCTELASDFEAARFHYANILLEVSKAEEALVNADILLERDPANPVFRALKAMGLELIDRPDEAAVVWADVAQDSASPECWVRYSHVLRTLGHREKVIEAARQAIALDPSFGRAYWALAHVKPFQFSDTEVSQMEAQAARPELSATNRIPLLFALGKAYADRKHYEKSFNYYARGNALRRLQINLDPGQLTAYVERCRNLFTEGFFRTRAGFGCKRRDPIFLIGMTRAGSTLVEQILASHSRIEGTRELFELKAIGNHLQYEVAPRLQNAYPDVVGTLNANDLEALGERYLEMVRPHRKLNRPFFIDKMGNNFLRLGLLHLILPNAKVIDVRRNPLACCFSNFTQLYANGQNDTYRLTDLASLYRDYVDLMAHFDRVLPGRVHRVFYEQLVAEPEAEVRRLLAYLELPFEETCLEFYKNERAVSTISSVQVRTPIYTEALEHWRHYEPWLGPLKAVLGPIAEAYPDIPSQTKATK